MGRIISFLAFYTKCKHLYSSYLKWKKILLKDRTLFIIIINSGYIFIATRYAAWFCDILICLLCFSPFRLFNRLFILSLSFFLSESNILFIFLQFIKIVSYYFASSFLPIGIICLYTCANLTYNIHIIYIEKLFQQVNDYWPTRI